MRILIVTQYFWPESFRINDLALGLTERGHRVTVLTGMPNYPSGELFDGYGWFMPLREIFQGIEIVRVPLITRGKNRNWRLALNYLSFALFASLFGPWRCRGSFDMVFIYQPSPLTVGIPGLILGRIKHAPVIIWVQDLWPETIGAVGAVRSKFALRAVGKLSDCIYRACDLILAQSKAFIPRLAARGIDASKLSYMPNWAEDFYRPAAQPEAGPDPIPGANGFRVVFAGNIGSAQSFETIVAAASLLRDFSDIHWVVIGDGHMRAWLEAELVKRGLESNFRLLGRQPPENMPLHFAYADALLVTLRAEPVFSLTVPSKIQSYLACGKPLIGSLNGEGADVIEEAGAGIACRAEDAGALADAVLKVYRMTPPDRMRLGDNGRSYFEAHFERRRLLDQLDIKIRELASEHHADTYTGR